MSDTNIKADIVKVTHESIKTKQAWLSPVITTVISILVAIGLTWYQINRAETEAAEAEIERVKSVKSTMISIVEDHVINKQPIDISRLSRLIDVKSREANINSTIRVLEIVQLAELNILNSGYLDFKTKEEFKKVFDSIYKNVRNEYKINHTDVKHAALIEDVVSSIKLGKMEESVGNLQLLVEAYSSDIKTLEAKQRKTELFKILYKSFGEKPMSFIVVIIIYFVLLIYFIPLFKKKIRKISEK
jgi:hypothetical protein